MHMGVGRVAVIECRLTYKRRKPSLCQLHSSSTMRFQSAIVMKAIMLAAVLAIVSAGYSSEEDSYVKVAAAERFKRQTASDFGNTKPFDQAKPNSPEIIIINNNNNKRSPPYASTFFAAYRKKEIGQHENKREEPSDFDYLKDVPKQSAYNPISYSTYLQQNAKQADYIIGASYNSY
ncbi:hypothetical protein DAPPUDRAFT_100332 [Daphnia pulex]|uniref:Uncharacterized protein n=1 Tax=Daphnia pulex TaxID=6669 RepID=E9GA33_DAPPU|nr:hypothetical protein DAPPUDRAFT_100332 [Daphnia pulex]|eukprot:EFX83774.1 hypothetical protein DAPPUDRAFT_100332 [Daphnia pulex]